MAQVTFKSISSIYGITLYSLSSEERVQVKTCSPQEWARFVHWGWGVRDRAYRIARRKHLSEVGAKYTPDWVLDHVRNHRGAIVTYSNIPPSERRGKHLSAQEVIDYISWRLQPSDAQESDEMCFAHEGGARSRTETPYGRWQADLLAYPFDEDEGGLDDRDILVENGGYALSWRAPHQWPVSAENKIGMVFHSDYTPEWGAWATILLAPKALARIGASEEEVVAYASREAYGNY